MANRENTSYVMSNREYEQFMKRRKADAYKRCDPLVKAFVECTQNRLLSVAWACREQNKQMQDADEDLLMKAEQDYLREHRK